ncbi:hypothetical protein [Caldilinea sp.]|uniref:hypothetical protein n=1 Tax=Caldilinea sp. TaxID=2293560 RepID=UPI002C68CA9E|nr:hypothetical protein [Caldilinea sp.]
MNQLAKIVRQALLAAALLTQAACVSPAALTPATPTSTSRADAAPEYVLDLTDAVQTAPPTLPAGVRSITAKNIGQEVHAVIFKRLNEDVTMEQFTAAFTENPFFSLRLTTQLGGPDTAPGTSTAGYYQFQPGAYVLTDNATQPPRFAAFTVEASTVADAQPPAAAVTVEMQDGELVMPAEIKPGAQWWQFTNASQKMHMLGIVKLAAGKTVDDIVAWDKSGNGTEPFEWIAFWNLMSPGVTSWGELDLPPGAYWGLDFATEPTEAGMTPPALGTLKAITVTE